MAHREVSKIGSSLALHGPGESSQQALMAKRLPHNVSYGRNNNDFIHVGDPSRNRFVVSHYFDTGANMPLLGTPIWVNPHDRRYRVVDIATSTVVSETSAAQLNLQVQKCAATDAFGAGKSYLGAREFNVEALGMVEDTVTAAALDPVRRRISLSIPIGDLSGTGDLGGTIFSCPTGRTYRILAITEAHEVVSNDSTTHVLTLKKCTANQDPTGAGSDLSGGTSFDLKGVADDLVTNLVLSDVAADLEIAAGERIAWFSNEGTADNTATIRPVVTVELEETTVPADQPSDLILAKGDRLVVGGQDNSQGATEIAGAEYEGLVQVTLEPMAGNVKFDEVIKWDHNIGSNLAATGATLFTARDSRYKLISISEVHSVVDGAATANLKVERLQGTEAAAAGDDLLGATAINLKGTVNVVQTKTLDDDEGTGVTSFLTASDIHILEIGDRLGLHMAIDDATATALGTYVGAVTCVLRPLVDDHVEQLFVNQTFTDTSVWGVLGQDVWICPPDQSWKLQDVAEVHTKVVAPTGGAMMIERCQKDPGSAGEAVTEGDELLDADIVDDGTVNTVLYPVVSTSKAVAGRNIGELVTIFSPGDRLVIHHRDLVNAAEAVTAGIGCVTCRFTRVHNV